MFACLLRRIKPKSHDSTGESACVLPYLDKYRWYGVVERTKKVLSGQVLYGWHHISIPWSPINMIELSSYHQTITGWSLHCHMHRHRYSPGRHIAGTLLLIGF
jgi:hypothetical protein